VTEDDQQLIKAGADAVVKPFSDLLIKLLGPLTTAALSLARCRKDFFTTF
jgi:hypothetical protein